MNSTVQRDGFIDTLKGILIIFVLVLHFPIKMELQNKLLFPFWIYQTVPCFMFLSGYVFSRSFQKRQICHLGQAYQPQLLAEKLIRFSAPYTIAFIAEWIVFRIFKVYLTNIRTYGILALFMDYLRGGKGLGSYYFPLLIQFIFVFPIVYLTIKKYRFKGLIFFWCINGIYEILKIAYQMDENEYSLLVFRYLFVMAVGCYCAFGSDKKNRNMPSLLLFCEATGIFFTFLFSYTDYSPKILIYWSTTSFLTSMFIIPVIAWLVQHIHKGFKPLEIIGRASFNIFLIQMIYFNFADRMYERIPSAGLQIVFNIVNCVSVGVIFYYLENPLTKWFIKKITAKIDCLQEKRRYS